MERNAAHSSPNKSHETSSRSPGPAAPGARQGPPTLPNGWLLTSTDRGAGLRAGKCRHPQILVPCVQLREPQALGYKKIFWERYDRVHKIILWDTQGTQEKFVGICTGMTTDPDMQYTGPSASLRKENGTADAGSKELARGAQKNSAVPWGMGCGRWRFKGMSRGKGSARYMCWGCVALLAVRVRVVARGCTGARVRRVEQVKAVRTA